MARVTVVMNPKGGVGKSTLATNLAGYHASRGHAVMLGDVDKQQSSREWLKLRPAQCAPIASWDIERGKPAKPPKEATHIVLDTPAGISEKLLDQVVAPADRVIVPLQASMLDILATKHFLAMLAEDRAVRRSDALIGVVGMRVDSRTRAFDELQRFLDGLGLPVLGYIRNTQNYVQLAARGLTLFDIAPGRVQQDLEQWQPILRWLEG
ncbi:MAG: ParA family protein [Burkholderiales bacterium]|nr:ParA family protein [Burkholderiales bacterium]